MPPSLLESLPNEIIQKIAFFCVSASSSHFCSTRGLFALMATCSIISRQLDVAACPHLYAQIFRMTFDFDRMLHAQLDDMMLASEFVARKRLLRRASTKAPLRTLRFCEAWVLFRMAVENAGLNEALLISSGLLSSIRDMVESRIVGTLASDSPLADRTKEADRLSMWVYCLTLTPEYLMEIAQPLREQLRSKIPIPVEVLGLVHRSSSRSYVDAVPQPSMCPHLSGSPASASAIVKQVHMSITAPVLDDPLAAIIILFAYNQVKPLIAPPHLPTTRAVALANQRSGPTQEDFQTIARDKIPLYANLQRSLISAVGPQPRHEMYDTTIRRSLFASYRLPADTCPHNPPGPFEGSWTGFFMTSKRVLDVLDDSHTCPPSTLVNLNCMKPMQCTFTTYSGVGNTLVESLKALESATFLDGNGRLPPPNVAPRQPSEPHNAAESEIYLLGETDNNHEQAWGGFRFAARASADGYLRFLREPKNAADGDCHANWLFEGRLRYGHALVGYVKSWPDQDVFGVFGMQRPS